MSGVSLGIEGLKARLEAYYRIVAPAQLDDAWDERFRKIYEK